MIIYGLKLPDLFLSTLPARGATSFEVWASTSGTFLSTLPARGATKSCQYVARYIVFLSTLPARGATLVMLSPPLIFVISIHAPREGSDCP